jgi:hypothetical protein
MEDTVVRQAVVILASAAMLALGVPLAAHHSGSAAYLEDKSQTIEGRLVQFIYRNPHSLVHVDVPDQSGAMTRWVVEWVSGQALSGLGITRETLKAGDMVVVSGAPGRNASEHRLLMRNIVRPKDGWKWTGTSR